jgi:hypothetical protein
MFPYCSRSVRPYFRTRGSDFDMQSRRGCLAKAIETARVNRRFVLASSQVAGAV